MQYKAQQTRHTGAYFSYVRIAGCCGLLKPPLSYFSSDNTPDILIYKDAVQGAACESPGAYFSYVRKDE